MGNKTEVRRQKTENRKQKTGLQRRFLLCLLSAVLLVLSFPGFNLEFCAWFGFVPLFFAARGLGRARSFLLFYLAGIFFWWGTIYWLVNVTFIGTFVLVLYLALYFGVFGLFFSSFYRLWTIDYGLSFSAAWVLLEYIRSHLFSGFPWALLGYSQYLNLAVIQIADITGAWGISFIVVAVNCAIAGIIINKDKGRYKAVILAGGLLILIYGYGMIKLFYSHGASIGTARVSVVQASIPQELKWDPLAREFISAQYERLTRLSAVDNPDLIIWSEAALPVILEEEPRYFEKTCRIAVDVKTPLLLGAVTLGETNYYNSALLVSDNGKLSNAYKKLHLVPFGEYIPFRRQLPFLETIAPIGDISPGKEYVVFNSNGKEPGTQFKFSVLICFEDLFSEISRKCARQGAQFLVNITNDAWYKKTSAAEQHLQASVFRAVESGLSLARCANTGISGFISPRGKIMDLVSSESGEKIFVEGYRTHDIDLFEGRHTFYTRYGDCFVTACFLLVLWGIILNVKRKAKGAKLK